MKAPVYWTCGSVLAFIMWLYSTLVFVGDSNETIIKSLVVFLVIDVSVALVIAGVVARRQRLRLLKDVSQDET